MIRKIIEINEEKCNGCGACAKACHEGAIKMINGKAHLIRTDYCDGLGDCLPACPTGAIKLIEKEALPYDEEAVLKAKRQAVTASAHSGCMGMAAKKIEREPTAPLGKQQKVPSRLMQWPCQIKLISPRATYLEGADLLIAADCTAYAYGNFHEEFIKDHITLIGCPKLDATDYSQKLFEILYYNNVKSITVVRMEVPCCGGIELAARKAIEESKKNIPLKIITISTSGKIL